MAPYVFSEQGAEIETVLDLCVVVIFDASQDEPSEVDEVDEVDEVEEVDEVADFVDDDFPVVMAAAVSEVSSQDDEVLVWTLVFAVVFCVEICSILASQELVLWAVVGVVSEQPHFGPLEVLDWAAAEVDVVS